jgi:hypothetical protein
MMPRDVGAGAWAVLPGVVGAIMEPLEVAGGTGGGGLIASAGPPGATRRTTVSVNASTPPVQWAAAVLGARRPLAHSHEALPNMHVLATGAR